MHFLLNELIKIPKIQSVTIALFTFNIVSGGYPLRVGKLDDGVVTVHVLVLGLDGEESLRAKIAQKRYNDWYIISIATIVPVRPTLQWIKLK